MYSVLSKACLCCDAYVYCCKKNMMASEIYGVFHKEEKLYITV